MATDLSGLVFEQTKTINDVNSLALAANNVALVIPEIFGESKYGYQPQNKGANDGSNSYSDSAILFHYEAENSVQVDSDITDHFVEDNTSVQDQIALKPELITVNGFIGELNNVPPVAAQAIKSVADKLFVLSAFQPAASITAQIAYNDAFQAYQIAINTAKSAITALSTIAGGGGKAVIDGNGISNGGKFTQSKQQIIFQQFYSYWLDRRLFTVQTPWALFKNMAIKSMRTIQNEDTNVITDFEITFKLIRFSKSKVVTNPSIGSYDYTKFQGRSYMQGAPAVGIETTPQAVQSLSSELASA